VFILLTGAALASPAVSGNAAQDAAAAAAELRAGKSFIPTPVASEADDLKLLELFKGLRAADVVDGMDAVGLKDIGLMSPDIQPLWRDTERFEHRFAGIAITVRYVPTQRPPAGALPVKDYDAWAGDWYDKLSGEPFLPVIRKGTALVIEDAPDVGTIGSYNILEWFKNGCVGVVTSASARDTDEIILQRIPLYLKRPARGIRPGRNEIESVNRPVVCGGALVIPGDVVVADGDGVVVVPRAKAAAVAAYARGILENDKAGRRELYKETGRKEDASVKK
jgi:regulator of RNase E activity RraA